MKNKKVMALILAATMVVGSSLTVFAADANSADSDGTSFDHVDTEVIDVTLPTTEAVATVFNYYVDPEGAIKNAGQLLDGTTVTGNTDGVYFTNAGTPAVAGTVSSSITADSDNDYIVTVSDLNTNQTYTYKTDHWENEADEDVTGTVTITVTQNDGSTPGTLADNDTVTVSGAVAAGAASYSSSSDKVKFEGKNSVDVDVTVTAAVTATDAEKDIALVADDAALSAATGPALLMTLKVGSDSKVITSAGASAQATIEGVADNFEVKPNDGGDKFVFALKDSGLSPWESTELQLVGKANSKDVPTTGMTVPKITLTWSVAKHVDEAAPSIATKSYKLEAGTAINITVDLGKGSKQATSGPVRVVWDEVDLDITNQLSYADSVLTISGDIVDALLAQATEFPAKLIITFDDPDSTEVEVSLTK